MKIRKATANDKDKLLPLVTALHVEHKNLILSQEAQRFEEYRNTGKEMKNSAFENISNPNFITFVVEKDAKFIGYICGQIKEKPRKVYNREGYIEDLFVVDAHRRRGLAKKLFAALLTEFQLQGCTHIATDAYVTNYEALRIYKRWGFHERVVTFYKALK